ncbi:diacylglycerol kinase [Macrococcus epidermidis]|uniref:Diacylglycerol kinase n=1 Tax=Macrococcus epidermidis TaxID=1902580 RepID=A0A328A0I1_9STAP|nr:MULTISPECIES: diacylglycerol kinase family protein [Macrococcus]MCG7420103.1 diacylglycerol kinase family protein [Macrococcus epidermidis]MCH4984183.1 diacylglycerol kinase family protein [Macrococcus sp. PK]RAK46898.1 diacylglycerol kinase [Macrococcus epidermidis]UTH15338.1 diacylglycerol kinase family protein [Macrococcus epidermidis]
MKRFLYPIQGFITLLKKDVNFVIHLIAAILVVMFSFYFQITKIEWLFVIIAIFSVLFMEVINTSVEYVVDLVTEDYHELAKHAKDTAAFAVLLSSIMSAIIGIIIFMPYIIELF